MPVKDGRSGPQDAAEACRRGVVRQPRIRRTPGSCPRASSIRTAPPLVWDEPCTRAQNSPTFLELSSLPEGRRVLHRQLALSFSR